MRFFFCLTSSVKSRVEQRERFREENERHRREAMEKRKREKRERIGDGSVNPGLTKPRDRLKMKEREEALDKMRHREIPRKEEARASTTPVWQHMHFKLKTKSSGSPLNARNLNMHNQK